MQDPYTQFNKTILPNGLSVYVSEWEGRPWEAVGFVIHAGASKDTVGKEGSAHFLEHLISSNAPLPFTDMQQFFVDRGGKASFGETGFLDTQFSFFIPIADIEKALELFGKMLLQNYLEKFFEHEKNVVKAECRKYFPWEQQYTWALAHRSNLFEGLWLSRFAAPGGSIASIENITPSDIFTYYKTYYVPANISIVAVGGLSTVKFLEYLSSSPFAIHLFGQRSTPHQIVGKFLPIKQNRQVISAKEWLGEKASAVPVGNFKMTVRLPGNLHLGVYRIISQVVRLVLEEEFRYKLGWVYSVQVVNSDRQGFYELAVATQTEVDKVEKIESLVFACIANIQYREDIFIRAKNSVMQIASMIDLNARQVRNGVMNDLVFENRPVPYQEMQDRVDGLTFEGFLQVLTYFSPEHAFVSIDKP